MKKILWKSILNNFQLFKIFQLKELRKIKLSVKAAKLEEEKSLLKKFGNLKSGATLKNIFETALGTKGKKKKKED